MTENDLFVTGRDKYISLDQGKNYYKTNEPELMELFRLYKVDFTFEIS